MDNKYEIIVVGAGPAGGQCARELAKIGRNVLLLERSKVVGEPNFSSGAKMKDTIKIFDLPRKVIQTSWNGLLIASKNEKAEFSSGKALGYVLDYKTLKQFLFNDAKKNGADVVSGAMVENVTKEGNTFTGVILDGQKIGTEVIIDATGPATALGLKAGLVKDKGKQAIGIEYLMQNVRLENNKLLQFYLGTTFAPSGYMWIFPTKIHEAKVGTAKYFSNDISSSRSKLNTFIKTHSETKNATIIDVHGGPLYFNRKLKTHSNSNLMIIGDAAGQSNPLGGEGIRHAMTSGRIAATVCSKYINSGNGDLRLFRDYNKLWNSYTQRRWLLSYVLTKMVYSNSTDANMDKLVSLFEQMTLDEIVGAFFGYRFASLPKYISFMIGKLLEQKQT